MHTLMFPLVTAMGVMSRLDPVPEDEDIKAGYVALFLWVGLLIVIALLGRSMMRHLRTSEANRKAGVYPGDPSEPTQTPGSPDASGTAGGGSTSLR